MKQFLLAILGVLMLVMPAAGQQTQPPVLETPVQYAPVNNYIEQATGPAPITITGVANQRVRLYSIKIWCGSFPGGTPAQTLIPAIKVSDGATTTYFTLAGVTKFQEGNPIGNYRWLPGLAFPVGGTVVVTGNNGGACTQGTFMHVQADQF